MHRRWVLCVAVLVVAVRLDGRGWGCSVLAQFTTSALCSRVVSGGVGEDKKSESAMFVTTRYIQVQGNLSLFRSDVILTLV